MRTSSSDSNTDTASLAGIAKLASLAKIHLFSVELIEAGLTLRRLLRIGPRGGAARCEHAAPIGRSLVAVLLLPVAAGIALVGAAIIPVGMVAPVIPRGIGKACAADQGRCERDRPKDLLH